jgi:glutathione S-transferase
MVFQANTCAYDGFISSRKFIVKLYYTPLSGHCHRVQLFAGLIGADIELIPVDLASGEHRSAAFLKLNPFGQVPVLVDGDVVISDSNAILVYLATVMGKTEWLPTAAGELAAVQKWLSVAAGEIMYGPCAARLITVFGAAFNAEEVIARSHRVLKLIDAQLAGQTWIALDHVSLADVALYSYIARAPEGGVDLSDYANVHAWLARIEALPGFVPFPQSTSRAARG